MPENWNMFGPDIYPKDFDIEILKSEIGQRFPFYDTKFNANTVAFYCRIDELTLEPRPPGVTMDPKDETWQLRIKDLPIKIDFTIDEDNHRIRIFSLQSINGGPTPKQKPGG